MNRPFFRTFVFLFAFAVFAASIPASVPTPEPTVAEGIAWYDTTGWGIEGKGWEDTSTHFTRMPLRAKDSVPESVWNLSRHSAGLVVRFRTDADRIQAKHELAAAPSMPHMTNVGSSGLDLYAKDEKGVWRWAGASKPPFEKSYEQDLITGMTREMRDYMLYLPLYNTTTALSVGVPENCRFEAVGPSEKKPIFYYGTSIAHGCSASRPGMTVPALLGRRLDMPVINFGFSGNGRMEIEMERLIEEVDSAVFVLDCVPNMTFEHIKTRTEPFIRALRKARPATPIVMIEDRIYSSAWLQPKWMHNRKNKCTYYKSVYDDLVAEGVTGLYYLVGDELFGTDNDGTVDGSHPSDLGMVRMTDVVEPVLREVLERSVGTLPRFRKGAVSVFLNPSLQPKNIGWGDYGTEEDRMHELSEIIRKHLEGAGITVYENKIGMTLRESIAHSNEKKPTIHIALHSNAFNKQVRGVESYHRESGEKVDQCKRLATKIYDGLLEIYDGPRRGVKATSTLIEPRTVEAPNTLVEVAFHDNEIDSKWILENMNLIGENIARSIAGYLAETEPEALEK